MGCTGALATYTYTEEKIRCSSWDCPGSSPIYWLPHGVATQTSRNIYFGGRLIQSNNTTVVLDGQGSVRAKESNETFEYFPYGEEMATTANDREKFATYTRESSTGLDYADQRYYSSVYGTFTSADPLHSNATSPANPRDPGSWNRYSYAGGDPVNRVDPTGNDDCFDAIVDPSFAGPAPCGDPLLASFSLDASFPSCFGSQSQADLFNPSAAVDCIGMQEDDNSHVVAPTPICEIGLFYRKAFLKFLPWKHSYLADFCTLESNSGVLTVSSLMTIQADPGPITKPGTTPVAPPGYLGGPWLIGTINFAGAGPGHSDPNAPGNFQIGTWATITLGGLQTIGAAVLNYDYNPAPYTLFPYDGTTYNSNSFVFTLISNFGLGLPITKPSSTPGWGNFVPGLHP